MKKYMIFVLALLLVSGVANAASIPMVVDPKNHPEVWTTEVYNNYGSAITSDSVVVWQFASANATSAKYTGNWVTLSTTQSDPLVAGVVMDDSIAASDSGTIAIRGPVAVKQELSSGATQLTANDLCGASSTAGEIEDYTDAADNAHLGLVIRVTMEGETPSEKDKAIVFVNPGWAD